MRARTRSDRLNYLRRPLLPKRDLYAERLLTIPVIASERREFSEPLYLQMRSGPSGVMEFVADRLTLQIVSSESGELYSATRARGSLKGSAVKAIDVTVRKDSEDQRTVSVVQVEFTTAHNDVIEFSFITTHTDKAHRLRVNFIPTQK